MNGIEFLLDTNVIIGILSQAPSAQLAVEKFGIQNGGHAVSQISRIELLSFPALTAADEMGIRNFLADCAILPIDNRVEVEVIALRRRTRLRLPDAIIGATAHAHGLKLVTLDKRLEAIIEAWISDQS